MEELKDVTPYCYYLENVFQTEDLYLFRAVFNFYRKDYSKAIADFKHCQHLKLDNDKKTGGSRAHESMMLYSKSNHTTPALSMNSSKTDLSDVGLCSVNSHETNFNLLLCYIQLKEIDKCFEKATELIASNNKYGKSFYLIRGLLYESQNDSEKALKDFEKYAKYEPKAYN